MKWWPNLPDDRRVIASVQLDSIVRSLPTPFAQADILARCGQSTENIGRGTSLISSRAFAIAIFK